MENPPFLFQLFLVIIYKNEILFIKDNLKQKTYFIK